MRPWEQPAVCAAYHISRHNPCCKNFVNKESDSEAGGVSEKCEDALTHFGTKVARTRLILTTLRIPPPPKPPPPPPAAIPTSTFLLIPSFTLTFSLSLSLSPSQVTTSAAEVDGSFPATATPRRDTWLQPKSKRDELRPFIGQLPPLAEWRLETICPLQNGADSDRKWRKREAIG